jgi:hypothetical protein
LRLGYFWLRPADHVRVGIQLGFLGIGQVGVIEREIDVVKLLLGTIGGLLRATLGIDCHASRRAGAKVGGVADAVAIAVGASRCDDRRFASHRTLAERNHQTELQHGFAEVVGIGAAERVLVEKMWR